MSKLGQLGLDLISECQKLEPSQVEVCIDEVQETKIVYEQTDFSVSTSSHITTFGVRSMVDGKLGFITTNSLNESNLKDQAREVQNIARLSPKNPNYKIAPKSTGHHELFDPRISEMAPKEILKHAENFIQECRKDSRVLMDRAEISVSTSTRIILNSNGVNQQARQSIANWYVMGMASENNEVTSFDYDGDSASFIGEIEPKILKTAQLFRNSVIGSLKAKGCKSYQGKILLHPAAVADLLGGVIGFNVNGRAQQDGMSKWKDLAGSEVASNKIYVFEDPQDTTRPGAWTPFDREGVITSKNDILKNGVLKLTAHNMFSSTRAGVKPTGHASGGSRSTPGIGLHAMSFGKGDRSLDQLYSDLGSGLVLKRFSGNEDPISGVFSGVAKNSWWVDGGKYSHPVKEVMISGNLFDLLKNVVAVGSEIIRQSGSFDSPYILIDGVSVTSN